MSQNHPVSSAPEWVALAAFAQPHGVSGRIKVKSFTEPADDFVTHQPLSDEAGALYKMKITGHAQGMAIVTVEGITDRNQAELLRGKRIGVARGAMPTLTQPNRYYTDDLIGMEVIDQTGKRFGEVIHVANYGAGDILDIRRDGGKEEMYAFTNATFPVVDLEARRITIEPPIVLGNKDDET